MAIDRKYGTVTMSGGKHIPDDEPVFVIRAKDAASVPTIIAYMEAAHNLGARGQFIEDIFGSIKRFENWQLEHSVKVPD